MPPAGIIAFGLPGHWEWILLLVVGLLLFGRRLPEVGRAIGRTVTEFRRGLSNFKREMDSDPDLREARSAVEDIQSTIRAPAQLTNPKRLFDNLTDESRSTRDSVEREADARGNGDANSD